MLARGAREIPEQTIMTDKGNRQAARRAAELRSEIERHNRL